MSSFDRGIVSKSETGPSRHISARAGLLLSRNLSYVPDADLMPFRRPVRPYVSQSSFGAHLLHHLASNGPGLAGGQGAVVTLVQGDADFIGGLHFELIHGRTGLGDHDLAVGRLAAVARHNRFLLFFFLVVWETPR